MLIVGSEALIKNNPDVSSFGRIAKDMDYICTLEQYLDWYECNKNTIRFSMPVSGGKYFHAQDKTGFNYEFEIAWEGTSAWDLLAAYNCLEVGFDPEFAINSDLYLIKMCHRFKKNSPHFKKTMEDILFLRGVLGEVDCKLWMEYNKTLVSKRESESYTYAHPKLNVSSKDFFNGDGVNYVYDHDSIHLAVALDSYVQWGQPCPDNKPGCMVAHGKRVFSPAYTKYMKDGSEVMTSKDKFYSVDTKVRLYGVYEESCVLALERSQIPHGLGKDGGPTPRWSFEKALEKVCTSITSGWFREYAWENYHKVMDLYEEMGEDDYVKRFESNQHLLVKYKE